jgi:hypothetical protein
MVTAPTGFMTGLITCENTPEWSLYNSDLHFNNITNPVVRIFLKRPIVS